MAVFDKSENKKGGALALSRADQQKQRRNDRWEYFKELRERVFRELEETGTCSLLDQALRGGELYLLDKMALNEACRVRLDGAPGRTYEDGVRLVQEYGNGYREETRLSWSQLNGYRLGSEPVTEEERKRWQKLLGGSGERPGDLRQLQEALTVQRETNRKLNADLSDRDREIGRLNGELQALREQLRSEKEALLGPARQEAEDIRAAARRQGEAEAARIREQAEADAQRLRAERRREIQALWQEEYAKGEGERQAYTDSLLAVRRELTDETSRFQGEVVDRLNTAVEELNRVKRELCTDLRSWQEGLYRIQNEPLATCYVNLVRILAKGETLAMAEGGERGAGERGGTAHLLANLDRFRQSLEKAMLRLGLEVFYARPGERFDPARHAEAGAEYCEYETERRVRRCTCPGVEYHVSEEEDSRILVSAEVELEG